MHLAFATCASQSLNGTTAHSLSSSQHVLMHRIQKQSQLKSFPMYLIYKTFLKVKL